MSSIPTLPAGRWQVKIDKETFNKVRSEQSFWDLVALSRVVNGVRFVHSALEFHQDDSPRSLRVRYNSFLFNCALMYEASLFVNRLGKYYAGLTEYKAMVGLFNAQDTQEFIQGHLGRVRNRVAFHFGPDEIGAQLGGLDFAEPIFVSGVGSQNSNVYYELADLCAMNTFTARRFSSPQELWGIVEPLVKKTSDLTIGFLTTAEEFIVTVLEDSGWCLVEVAGNSSE